MAETSTITGAGESERYLPVYLEAAAIERETHRIARAKGCDRGFFAVCWAEHECGAVCRCKEEARAALTERGAGR